MDSCDNHDDNVYFVSTISFNDHNQDNPAGKVEDEHEDEHKVHNSLFSTTDFEGVDFGPILADLDLIRQDGRLLSETGSSWLWLLKLIVETE